MLAYVGTALYFDIEKLSSSKSVLKIDYWLIPLALIPITLHILLLGFRFHRYLKAVGVKIPLRKSVLLYILGLSLAATPASSGQVIRSQIIKKQFGYAISKTSIIVLVEKWNELTAALLILTVLAILNSRMIESIVITILGTAIAVIVFGMVSSHTIFTLFKGIILKFRRLKTFEQSIENSQEVLSILFSKKSLLIDGFLITTTAQICQAICVFFTFHAIGIKLGFVISTQIFFTAIISGILSFVPGGVFVTEGSMLGLLNKYYDNDNKTLALLASAVIFVRLATIWYGTLLGLITAKFILKTTTTTEATPSTNSS